MTDNAERRKFFERHGAYMREHGYRLPLNELVAIADSDSKRDLESSLFAVGALGMWLADREMIAVFRARASGRSWSWIGERLGRSRQAVWERYRDLAEQSADE